MIDREVPESVEKFLGDRKILIADTRGASRVGIARALGDMGAVTSKMVLADSYEWAERVIQREKPQVIVLDYELESRSGLDLLEESEKNSDTLTVMVTHNNSQAVIAYAAEGEVDVFISKPYSLDTFRQSIVSAIETKLNPSEYLQTINEGRKSLSAGELEIARKHFENAIRLNEQPALAYFYQGQVLQLNQALNLAQASYLKGLEHNQTHYRCLVGLYEALNAQEKLDEAYVILRRIVSRYPLNPKRFAPLIKLAIHVGSYGDIEEYYDFFLKIDSKNDNIVKHACAGLIIAGKHFLKKKEQDRALRLFQKAAISAAGRTTLLREIILALASAGLAEEIRHYLARFSQEERGTTEFHALEYLALSMLEPLHVKLAHGRNLVLKGHHHPTIYRLLIQASLQAGFDDAAETLVMDAYEQWPELRQNFITLLGESAS